MCFKHYVIRFCLKRTSNLPIYAVWLLLHNTSHIPSSLHNIVLQSICCVMAIRRRAMSPLGAGMSSEFLSTRTSPGAPLNDQTNIKTIHSGRCCCLATQTSIVFQLPNSFIDCFEVRWTLYTVLFLQLPRRLSNGIETLLLVEIKVVGFKRYVNEGVFHWMLQTAAATH